MTHPTGDPAIPQAAERTTLNAALLNHGTETGFWDEHGQPAPWPDDIDQWQPYNGGPTTRQPGDQPF